MKVYICHLLIQLTNVVKYEEVYIVAHDRAEAKSFLKDKVQLEFIGFSGNETAFIDAPGHPIEPGYLTKQLLKEGKPFITNPGNSLLPAWTD